jgi:hypothetical protein
MTDVLTNVELKATLKRLRMTESELSLADASPLVTLAQLKSRMNKLALKHNELVDLITDHLCPTPTPLTSTIERNYIGSPTTLADHRKTVGISSRSWAVETQKLQDYMDNSNNLIPFLRLLGVCRCVGPKPRPPSLLCGECRRLIDED